MTKAHAEKQKTQLERFKDAAKQVETNDSEEAFDRALAKIAKAPVRTPSKISRSKKATS